MRRAKFQVTGGAREFNGTNRASVVIEQVTPEAPMIVRVRPLRQRREFLSTLDAIASFVIWREIKAEAAEKSRTRKRGRV